MKLTDEQKKVIRVLKHYYEISPSNEEVVIPSNELVTYYLNANKVDLILKKFSKDYAIIEYVRSDINTNGNYLEPTIIYKKEFEPFYDEYVVKEEEREERERQEWQEQQEKEEQERMDADYTAYMEQHAENKTETDTKEEKADDTKAYWLDYSAKNGLRIVLNNAFLLSKPNPDSENHRVFDYLFKNPNRKISTKEIQEHIDPVTI